MFCLKHGIVPLFAVKLTYQFVTKVKDHNSSVSKAGQLIGSKAQAVKNILNAVPTAVRKLIVDYTVEVGYEATPWSDDCLGSKKWLPGFALPD